MSQPNLNLGESVLSGCTVLMRPSSTEHSSTVSPTSLEASPRVLTYDRTRLLAEECSINYWKWPHSLLVQCNHPASRYAIVFATILQYCHIVLSNIEINGVLTDQKSATWETSQWYTNRDQLQAVCSRPGKLWKKIVSETMISSFSTGRTFGTNETIIYCYSAFPFYFNSTNLTTWIFKKIETFTDSIITRSDHVYINFWVKLFVS